jgi:DNA-binding CsgD family transcriptional regulator
MSGCVDFAVRDNDRIRKSGALLESLGEETKRNLAELDGDLFGEAAATTARRYRMTAREQQMLEALLRGLDRQQMAEALQVSRATIKWHIRNIYTKLGVRDGEHALRKALSLDDPRWLIAPQRHRNTLERMIEATEQVLRASKSDGRLLDGALARLEEELAAVRRHIEFEPAADHQRSLPSASNDSTPHASST